MRSILRMTNCIAITNRSDCEILCSAVKQIEVEISIQASRNSFTYICITCITAHSVLIGALPTSFPVCFISPPQKELPRSLWGGEMKHPANEVGVFRAMAVLILLFNELIICLNKRERELLSDSRNLSFSL